MPPSAKLKAHQEADSQRACTRREEARWHNREERAAVQVAAQECRMQIRAAETVMRPIGVTQDGQPRTVDVPTASYYALAYPQLTRASSLADAFDAPATLDWLRQCTRDRDSKAKRTAHKQAAK